jgi:hypothetical protein
MHGEWVVVIVQLLHAVSFPQYGLEMSGQFYALKFSVPTGEEAGGEVLCFILQFEVMQGVSKVT